MTKNPTPNDNRSNVMNPNNPAHSANNDNRSTQLNPQSQAPEKGNAPLTPPAQSTTPNSK